MNTAMHRNWTHRGVRMRPLREKSIPNHGPAPFTKYGSALAGTTCFRDTPVGGPRPSCLYAQGSRPMYASMAALPLTMTAYRHPAPGVRCCASTRSSVRATTSIE